MIIYQFEAFSIDKSTIIEERLDNLGTKGYKFVAYIQPSPATDNEGVIVVQREARVSKKTVKRFIEQRCILGNDESIPAVDLYGSYFDWALDTPEGIPMSSTLFYYYVEGMPGVMRIDSVTKLYRGIDLRGLYKGIDLRE
jgi:hypothetical protein